MSVAALCQTSVTVFDVVSAGVKDAMGGPRPVYTQSFTALAKVDEKGGPEFNQSGRKMAAWTHAVYFDGDVDILERCRITYVDGASATRTLQVNDVVNQSRPQTQEVIYTRCFCTETR